MKQIFLGLAALLLLAGCAKKAPEVIVTIANRDVKTCAGKVQSISVFSPQLAKNIEVDIWLPEGYPEHGKRYPVLYMHDGQNVLDSTHTWMHNEWQVDEAITSLGDSIDAPIVVAIYNDDNRAIDYMPENYYDYLPYSMRFTGINLEGFYVPVPMSTQYVNFIAETLKPYIDYKYQTDPKPEATALMGSSMGALISLYGIQRHPEVFGSALCLSFPAIDYIWDVQRQAIASLPDPATHRLYFDTGDADLDATFFPAFDEIEPILRTHGYNADNALVKVFPGEGHNEGAWARRLTIPLQFAFGK